MKMNKDERAAYKELLKDKENTLNSIKYLENCCPGHEIIYISLKHMRDHLKEIEAKIAKFNFDCVCRRMKI